MRWTSIKALLHNQVIKISYLIVVFLPILIEIFHALKLKLAIATSVYEVFYSGLLLLALVLLYNIFGPPEITHYSDIHDYVNKNKDDLLIAFPDKKKQIVMAHLDETQSQLKASISELDLKIRAEIIPANKQVLENTLESILAPIYPGCVTRYLQKQWNKTDTRKNWFILLFCFIIAGAAIGLALCVFYFRIKTVIDY